MLKKVLYYGIAELDDQFGAPDIVNQFDIPATITLKDYLDNTLGESNYPSLQTDITNSNVIKLWKGVFDKFFYHAIVKIELPFDTPQSYIDSGDFQNIKQKEYFKWIKKFLSLLDETSTYYLAVLSAYQSSATSLMDDITATSKNKVKFNDTPQNPNTSDVYEGDNYITHFTATEGETTSPLMTKIMRLKEIQDAYKDAMSDWVKAFERIFYQEEVVVYE